MIIENDSNEKLIAQVWSKDQVPPAAIQGKIKRGRVKKVWQGPRKGKFVLNPHDLHLEITARAADQKLILGKIIVKYDIDPVKYIRSVSELQESTQAVEAHLSREAKYDIAALIAQYDSSQITSINAKKTIEAKLENELCTTFYKKGILPYKITSFWQAVRSKNTLAEPYLQSSLDEVADWAHADNQISKLIKEKSEKLADQLLHAREHHSEAKKAALTKALELAYQRAAKIPGKGITDYVSKDEFNGFLRKESEAQLERLIGGE